MNMKGWKTVLLSIAVAAIGALETFNWADIIPDSYEKPVIMILGALFLYLRTITNTPVGKSLTIGDSPRDRE